MRRPGFRVDHPTVLKSWRRESLPHTNLAAVGVLFRDGFKPPGSNLVTCEQADFGVISQMWR